MELYFLRHGEAEWPDWKKSDDERPLTKRGKKEMHEVGAFLVRLKVRPELVLTIMIVGHEPDFTRTISALTGASLKLSKGGVALVDVDLASRRGRLLWLFPPKIAKN